MKATDVSWFAGLLEGEGYFAVGSRRDPRITVQMNDLDVVEKAHRLSGIRGGIHVRPAKGSQNESYRFVICGSFAAAWMMTVYPLMGSRRQQKIRECLAVWKESKSRPEIIRGLAASR